MNKIIIFFLFIFLELRLWTKRISEFFDDKIKSVFQSTFHMGMLKQLSPDEYSQLDLTTKLAIFDVLIVNWNLKTRWDAVRPFRDVLILRQDLRILNS